MGLYNLSLDCDCCEAPEEPIPMPPCASHTVIANWIRNTTPPEYTFFGNFAWQHVFITDQEASVKSKLFPPDGSGAVTEFYKQQYFTDDRDANHPSKNCSEWVNPGHPNPLLKPACVGTALQGFPPEGFTDCRFTIVYPSNATQPRTPTINEFLEPGSCWYPIGPFCNALPYILPVYPQFPLSSLATSGFMTFANGIFRCAYPAHVRNRRTGTRIGFEWDTNPPDIDPSATMWDAVTQDIDPKPEKAFIDLVIRREFAIAVAGGSATSGTFSYMMYPPTGIDGPDVTCSFKASVSIRSYRTDLDFARALHKAKIEGDDVWTDDASFTLPKTAKPKVILPSGQLDWSPAQVGDAQNFEERVEITEFLKDTSVASGVLGIHCGVEINGDGFAPSVATLGRYTKNYQGQPLNNFLMVGGWGSHAYCEVSARGGIIFE